MDQGERKIHSLKLRGSESTLLSQIRNRLEEAFRTATLPGLPPNAQVFIRRLDLGSISGDVSHVALSEIISERVRRLAASAVRLDVQSRTDADVVWFRDAFQPYAVLLARLLDGEPADEWYWRSLFPRHTLTLSGATLEMLLMASAETPLGALAPARLLQCTLTPQRLARLCPHITQAMAMRLLHRQGLSPVAVRWQPSDGQARSFENNRDAQQIDSARRHDNNTIAGHGMRPLAAPNFSPAWRHMVRMAADYWGVDDVRTLWCAWQMLVMHQPGYVERKDGLQRVDVAGWLASWAKDGDESSARVLSGLPFSTDNQPEQSEMQDRARTLEPAHTRSASTQREGRRPLSEHEHTGGRVQNEALRENSSAHDAYAPHSRHAGFAFVIPLLQRLGMCELLQHNDVLLEHDFTRRLLWTMADRFAVAEDDPLRALFDGWESGADMMLETIALPEFWPRMTTRFGRPKPRCPMSLHDLMGATQLMAAAYLRRFCRLSLRELLLRPGRVLLTPTHWDVIFDINQIDLRLRRVALDTDPGWVPWLGRVVQFHYDSEGQRYV